MASTTVNLMWIGNVDLLDPTPSTNITQAQLNAIIGHTATGKDEIKPVAVTGDYYTGYYGTHYFVPTFHVGATPEGILRNTASKMSYADPAGGGQLTNLTVNTFVNAKFDITVHAEDGTPSVVRQQGVLIQMSNGDLFFRPSTATINAWDSIDRISEVEVVDAWPTIRPTTDTPGDVMATIGFKAGIFDTEIVCFTRGTMIACPKGLRAVEDLKPGDLVITRDHGPQPIRWIGRQRLDAATLAAMPKLLPVRIRAGALGQGLPESDLLVSPQHRILVRSNIAQRMFGAPEVLVAAKQLLQIEGVDIAEATDGVEYFHFIFDNHEIVFSNGAETESLYPGAQAIKAVGPAARDELFAIFPQLRDAAFDAEAARPLISGRQARQMAMRHKRNGRQLLANMHS